MRIGKRSRGHSAVAAAAYRHAQRYWSPDKNRWINYTGKRGVEHSEIFAPEGAPSWVYDRQELWARVELDERQKNGQLFREVQLSLPKELDAAAQTELVRGFIRQNFVAHGMIADLAIHRDDAQNPHAHVMLTLKPLDPSRKFGFGTKLSVRDRWNSKKMLRRWRENWAIEQNRAYEQAGLNIRVDHRSYAARNLDLVPTQKVGLDVGQPTRLRIRDENGRIQAANSRALSADPAKFFRALEQDVNRAAWTIGQIETLVDRVAQSEEQAAELIDAVISYDGLVHLESGLFTTEELLELETDLVADAQELRGRADHVAAEKHGLSLGAEQQQAVREVLSGPDICVVEGAPGSGKSYLATALARSYQAAGYRVVGGAEQQLLVRRLGDEAGLDEINNLARWVTLWKNGRASLGAGDVMIIDEAAMIGSRRMAEIVAHAKQAQAKIIMLQDRRQLPPVGAGSPADLLARHVRASTVDQIRRQRSEAHRVAVEQMRTRDRESVKKALQTFENDGSIQFEVDVETARAAAVKGWLESKNAGREALILASSNDECRELGARAREELRSDPRRLVSAKEIEIKSMVGDIKVSPGDEVMLRRIDRDLGVANGDRGVVLAVSDREMAVMIDDRRKVIEFAKYQHDDGGVAVHLSYAVTAHKGQGQTVDDLFAVPSDFAAAQELLVQSSRHRHQLRLYFQGTKDQALDQFSQARSQPVLQDLERVERRDIRRVSEKEFVAQLDAAATEDLREAKKGRGGGASKLIDHALAERRLLWTAAEVHRDFEWAAGASPPTRSTVIQQMRAEYREPMRQIEKQLKSMKQLKKTDGLEELRARFSAEKRWLARRERGFGSLRREREIDARLAGERAAYERRFEKLKKHSESPQIDSMLRSHDRLNAIRGPDREHPGVELATLRRLRRDPAAVDRMKSQAAQRGEKSRAALAKKERDLTPRREAAINRSMDADRARERQVQERENQLDHELSRRLSRELGLGR